jgi:hypothetical protein
MFQIYRSCVIHIVHIKFLLPHVLIPKTASFTLNRHFTARNSSKKNNFVKIDDYWFGVHLIDPGSLVSRERTGQNLNFEIGNETQTEKKKLSVKLKMKKVNILFITGGQYCRKFFAQKFRTYWAPLLYWGPI